MKIKLIQHVNSPHVDEMINLMANENLDFEAWFAIDNLTIENNSYNSNFYSINLNISFIKYIFSKKNDLIIITGWMNINMIILILMFFLTNKLFFYWTDRPYDSKINVFKKLKRFISETILRFSNSKILCVGNFALDYFKSLKFKNDRLFNFPILTSPALDSIQDSEKKKWKESHLRINKNTFLISSGSRLEYEKGYDILIEAISKLNQELKNKLKVILVGEGSESDNLKQFASDLGVYSNFMFIGWQKINYFKNIISHSDLFVHPSRYDAYGASIYPLSFGVPVIGSIYSGVVQERVINNFNGLTYQNNDPIELSKKIRELMLDKNKLNELGLNALKDSKSHLPLNNLTTLKYLYNEFLLKK